MLEPTRDLLAIADGKDIRMTFFVDVGYLIAADQYPSLQNEKQSVIDQLKLIISKGHDIQLHIHPHWERAVFNGEKWEMNTEGAYRLTDFKAEERKVIFAKYKQGLEEIIGRKVKAYRAGGWCIQPFDELSDLFVENEILVDSSVIPGDFMLTDHYAIDFRSAPKKARYQFSDDVCKEDPNGPFIELPISSMRYSPLFFWQLYLLGRLFPASHKMIGDGSFISQGGRKKRVLSTYSYNHISTDGYFAKKLSEGLRKCLNEGFEEMVIIGHPKGNTKYGLSKLRTFIENNHKKHNFTSFHKEFCS